MIPVLVTRKALRFVEDQSASLVASKLATRSQIHVDTWTTQSCPVQEELERLNLSRNGALQSEMACGPYFPPECGYTQDIKQTLRCTGTGSKPVLGTTCTTECEVLVLDVSARCKPDLYVCSPFMAGNKVCASQFPTECGYSDEVVYYCGSVKERPVEIEDCKKPSVCEVNLDKGECITIVDPCNCPPGKETVCGSMFNGTCGLDPQTVYDCKDSENQPPLVVTECEPQDCISGDTTAHCEPDPCLCKGATGAFCGSTYLVECKLNNDTLYTCRAEGEHPEVLTECQKGACDPQTSSCKIDPCNCQSVGLVCGSDFDITCGCDTDGLYNCDAVGTKRGLCVDHMLILAIHNYPSKIWHQHRNAALLSIQSVDLTMARFMNVLEKMRSQSPRRSVSLVDVWLEQQSVWRIPASVETRNRHADPTTLKAAVSTRTASTLALAAALHYDLVRNTEKVSVSPSMAQQSANPTAPANPHRILVALTSEASATWTRTRCSLVVPLERSQKQRKCAKTLANQEHTNATSTLVHAKLSETFAERTFVRLDRRHDLHMLSHWRQANGRHHL
ncbi:hypothetical protein BGX34_000317 [Mortierella sp. NVP85]|nr:hypothetical protein BGX34_000317 [Mortierella sp. NVP85]